MDYIETALSKITTQTPKEINALGYTAFHELCGKDSNKVEEIFVWETVKAQVVSALENPLITITTEDGTII